MANENNIKAQIKLRFRNVLGRDLVCTRSMQVTMSSTGAPKFKTLESLLKIRSEDNPDEQFSLSSKCAEIDKEMPIHLGVSNPILQNVIFCHQEDSFWPISDSAILKKRFDDIFAATKYTKALDTIKALRKKLSDELKLKQKDLSNESVNRERSQKIEKEIQELNKICKATQDRITKLDTSEIKHAAKILNSIIERKQEVIAMQNRIDQFSVEKDILIKNCESLQAGLDISPRIEYFK